MPRPLPRLCIHKPSRRYYVRLGPVMHYLGPIGGPVEEAAAEARRAALLAKYAAGSTVGPSASVAVLAERYLAGIAETHTAKDRTIHLAHLRPLIHFQGATFADEYTPANLEDLRVKMAAGGWPVRQGRKIRPAKGWCRREINKAVTKIKAAFRAAVRSGIIPPEISERIQSVEPLRQGDRSTVAADHAEIAPADPASLAAFLKADCVQQSLRDMIELADLTGARPGELCRLTWGAIDQTGDKLRRLLRVSIPLGGTWVYLPGWMDDGRTINQKHKTARRGHRRVIPLCSRAREILARYADVPPDAPIFSPARCRAEYLERRRALRRSRVQPSQQSRAIAGASRRPGGQWTTDAFDKAVLRAWARINRERQAAGLEALPPFAPNQLRHSAATRLVDSHGWEVARILLGHTSPATTRIYAADNLARAIKAVADCPAN